MSNTSIETIKINGVDYVRADSATGVVRDIGPKRIIVADRGWVFVGDCEDNEDGSVTIRNARNIRQWGTTTGLGQLANGPTANTKHDDYGEVRCTPVVQINVIKGW
jgi:hypothetical protein